MGMSMGLWEYGYIYGNMPWPVPMQMNPLPMETRLGSWKRDSTNGDTAKELERWQQKIKKRFEALAAENTNAQKIKKRLGGLASIIKNTDFPWLTLDAQEHPIAPNPYDLTITKRQWEKAAMQYRHELIARATHHKSTKN